MENAESSKRILLRARPFSVKEYSATRGVVDTTFFCMNPSLSNSFNLAESILVERSLFDAMKSMKRFFPAKRSRRMFTLHFFPIWLMQVSMGQLHAPACPLWLCGTIVFTLFRTGY